MALHCLQLEAASLQAATQHCFCNVLACASDTAPDDKELDAAATFTAAKPYAPLALTISTQYTLIRVLCYSSRVPYC